MKKILILVSTALILAACASSGPTITANADPSADFRQFETWNFVQPMGTDRDNGARTPLSTALMASAEREMTARGLTRSDDPDLLVDFVMSAESRIDVRSTPSHTVHRSHWHRSWNTWPTYSTRVRQYTEGSLVIDLIDPRRGWLVAEAAATRRINDSSFDQAQIDNVVGLLFNSLWAQ